MPNTICLAVVSSTNAIKAWSVPADLTLTGWTFTGNATAIISEDPTLLADTVANASDQLFDKLIAAARALNNCVNPFTPLSFQLKKGQSVYFSSNLSGEFYVYYQLNEPTE